MTIAIGLFFLLLGLYNMVFDADFSAGTITLLAIGGVQVVGSLYFNHLTSGSITKIESNICERLDEQGYQHEIQEGSLYVTKNDNRFRIQISEGANNRIKNLFVIYDFGDKNFEKVNRDGWNRVANSINLNNTSTTFVALEDHFCCCYQSAISNAKDFMNEFNRAYFAIGEALDDYKKIYPYIERDYPNTAQENKNSIGFK
jgi:hypothetical protein